MLPENKKCIITNTLTIWIFIVLYILTSQITIAQTKIDSLREVWKNGKYLEVLPLLLQYRTSPYGRNAEVDYMIATSACRLSDYNELSGKCFKWILSNYSLDKKTRALVNKEMELCTPEVSPDNIFSHTMNAHIATSVGVRGKTFYWLDQDNAVTSIPVEVIRNVTYEEFKKRLFKHDEQMKSISYLEQFIEDSVSYYSTENFVIISLANHPKNKLQRICNNMEKVINFFVREYSMPKPEYLITIFLVSRTDQMRTLAEKLHGIRVSPNSIGYSFQDDLSIIGLLQSDDDYVGTLAHELFHLMARNHFGDIPPWMDEGMAALYEVLHIGKDTVSGLNNWRGQVLKRFWKERPSIDQLVSMDWDFFEAAEQDYESMKQTTNHAMARYFIFYLQEKGKLAETYSIFQKRKMNDFQFNPGWDSVLLLESILGKKITEVDMDFSNWFATLQN